MISLGKATSFSFFAAALVLGASFSPMASANWAPTAACAVHEPQTGKPDKITTAFSSRSEISQGELIRMRVVAAGGKYALQVVGPMGNDSVVFDDALSGRLPVSKLRFSCGYIGLSR